MSPLLEKPILHGRDHCPGGADPIPCMISGPSGDFEGVLLGTGPYAYWRLGETASPWADTSGFGSPDDLAIAAHGTALTPDVTGALASGDDGAVEFNYDGTGNASSADYLNSQLVKDFAFNASLGVMSVAVWVNVKASATTRRGMIIGNTIVTGGNEPTGWGLHVMYPGREIRLSRIAVGEAELYAETSGGVTAGEWVFIVGTYDGADIRLYANAELQETTADTTGELGVDEQLRVGWSDTDYVITFVRSWLYGSVDEAAVWTRALSQAEIDALYTAGVGGAGAGENVLLSDGAGGTYWGQVPTAAIEDDAVSSLKIADGTIVDADVATAADIDPLKIEHPGGTSTFLRADGTWSTPTGGGGSSPTDTAAWMPLTTVVSSVPELVWDADDNLIPTYTPI